MDGGKCFNDIYRNKRIGYIRTILEQNLPSSKDKEEIIRDLIQKTGISTLLEFSRSVHAEMNAILNVARHSSDSTENAILYTTTYPCHSCARHLIAAGIKAVFYVEPYDKSLAVELHSDAIVLDPEENIEHQNRVQFFHFEGVSPRSYQNMFLGKNERKDKFGNALHTFSSGEGQNVPELLFDYMDRETIVFKDLLNTTHVSEDIFGD